MDKLLLRIWRGVHSGTKAALVCLLLFAFSLSCHSQEPDSTPGDITFESLIGDVHFPHDLHVVDLELDCSECHHQIHAKDLDTPHPDYMKSSWIKCGICHDENSGMSRQYYRCSDCHHSELENIADETLSSKVVIHKNCWSCHESGKGATASKGCPGCHLDGEN